MLYCQKNTLAWKIAPFAWPYCKVSSYLHLIAVFYCADKIFLIQKQTLVTDFPPRSLSATNSVFKALANPTRLKILKFLDEHEDLSIAQIYENIDMEHSVVSQHLRILRRTNLVKPTRHGKFVHYSVRYELVDKIVAAAVALTEEKNERPTKPIGP
jgi:DNA-binding transcriptional ArsR family regulator